MPLCNAEIADLLNQLVEGERAGARGLIEMDGAIDDAELRELLSAVAKDEARFCAMLSHHVARLGGTPSRATGVFYDKLKARETLTDKLELLDRGQSAVVRMLVDAIPRINDSALRRDLDEMREVHVRNIERCAQYL
jgi:nitronate monooxygenase